MWVIRRIRGLRAPRGCARNRCRSMHGLGSASGAAWSRALLAVTFIAGVGAPAAVAGGVPVQIAAGGAAVWACSDSGVVKLDALSGRVLQRPRAGAPYPLQVALGGGAAWIASVESGYASGALTRVDLRTKQVRTQLRVHSLGARPLAIRLGSPHCGPRAPELLPQRARLRGREAEPLPVPDRAAPRFGQSKWS